MRKAIKDQAVKLAAAIRETGKHEIGLTFGVHRRRRGCAGRNRDAPRCPHGRGLRLTAALRGVSARHASLVCNRHNRHNARACCASLRSAGWGAKHSRAAQPPSAARRVRPAPARTARRAQARR